MESDKNFNKRGNCLFSSKNLLNATNFSDGSAVDYKNTHSFSSSYSPGNLIKEFQNAEIKKSIKFTFDLPHNRALSLTRNSLASDKYFMQKFATKNHSLSSKRNNRTVQNGKNESDKQMKFIGKELASKLKEIKSTYRKQERLVYISLIILVLDYSASKIKDIEDEEIIKIFMSDEFYQKLTILVDHIESQNFDKNVYKKKFLLAFDTFYSINITLYGYKITKLISSFFNFLFILFEIPEKKVRFIDYFDGISEFNSRFLKPKYTKTSKYRSDTQYETTKDDDDYLNTIEDYEDRFENEFEDQRKIQANYTEPDSRERLISKFYTKNKAVNPYEILKNFSSKQNK